MKRLQFARVDMERWHKASESLISYMYMSIYFFVEDFISLLKTLFLMVRRWCWYIFVLFLFRLSFLALLCVSSFSNYYL